MAVPLIKVHPKSADGGARFTKNHAALEESIVRVKDLTNLVTPTPPENAEQARGFISQVLMAIGQLQNLQTQITFEFKSHKGHDREHSPQTRDASSGGLTTSAPTSHYMTFQLQGDDFTFFKSDVSKAHRRIKIRPQDWKYMIATTRELFWVNLVGTYGVASAQWLPSNPAHLPKDSLAKDEQGAAAVYQELGACQDMPRRWQMQLRRGQPVHAAQPFCKGCGQRPRRRRFVQKLLVQKSVGNFQKLLVQKVWIAPVDVCRRPHAGRAMPAPTRRSRAARTHLPSSR